MTPEVLTEKIREICPDVISVILYGSAAAGDYSEKYSDYNVLVVTKELELSCLKKLTTIISPWLKAGNPPPLMFTKERLDQSEDVFPIELLDIKDCHKVLYGEDVVKDIQVNMEDLRLEVESEAKGKLIELRQQYLTTLGKPKALKKLMIESLSTFLVLARAALRLFQEDVPVRKMEALELLPDQIAIDIDAFRKVNELKTSAVKDRDVDMEALFEKYLKAVGSLSDSVDVLLRKAD